MSKLSIRYLFERTTPSSPSAFERAAQSCGVSIEAYHGDNRVFKSKEFKDALGEHQKISTFSGTGAHCQNGVAERNIRTVTEKARTMMQHSFLHDWPDEFQVDLWSFALHYSCWLNNHTPNYLHGWTPLEIFFGTCINSCQHLQRARVWGCPGYVLSPTLQDGKKIPKWAPRARRGQFLGFSKQHSSTIGLLRNLKTGHVSPQFHVVFDDRFTTVHSFEEDNPTWKFFGFSKQHSSTIGLLRNLKTGYVSPQFHVVFDERFTTVHSFEEDNPTSIELFTSKRDYYGPDEDEDEDEDENEEDALAFPDIDPSWLPIPELPLDLQAPPSSAATQDDNKAQVTIVDNQMHAPPLDNEDYGTPHVDDDVIHHLIHSVDTPLSLAAPDATTKNKRVRRPNKRISSEGA